MIKSIKLELFKIRHKYLGIMITLAILVQTAWAYLSVSISISRNPGRVGWKDIIMTMASMNGVFLPIICAVIVSRICDMEHKGNTWKLLISSSVKYRNIYGAKYICSCLLIFYGVILQALGIILFGNINQFKNPIPFLLILKFLGGTMLTNLVVISLQQWISLVIKNQSFALCVGMIGGFIGMTADLFPSLVRRVFIWSYYTGLCPITYHYGNDSITFVTQNIKFYLIIFMGIVGVTIYILGNIHFSRQEV